MNTYVTKRRSTLWIKILVILIPIIIGAYLIRENFIIDQDFNYFYDIGTGNENYLSPLVRVSEPVIGESYRNLTSQLVYFESPIAKGSETINVQIRFKNIFNENQTFLLGAKDQEDWHYLWNELSLDSGKGDWTITETKFNISQVYLQNGKLSLIMNVDHLNPSKLQEPQISIDWINITVHKPGAWK